MTSTHAVAPAVPRFELLEQRRLLSALFLGLSLLTRCCLARCTDLYSDEAYYLAWSHHPALGYFDHPPLLAWLLAVLPPRVLGPLLGVATDVAVYRLARAAGLDVRRALIAGAVFAWLPLNLLLGVLALPDAPLLLCWTLALTALLEQRWTGAAVAIGLAMESKYTGVLLVPLALAALQQARAWRALLPSALVVAVLVSPLVLWNASHGWASMRFQLHHGLSGQAGLGGAWRYALGQVAVTVGLAPLALLVRRRGAPRLLVWGACVPLGFFLISSLRAPVEANWPALAYPSLAVLVARAEPRWLTKWLFVVATVAWVAALSLLSPGPWSAPLAKPLARLHGWSALACLRGSRAVFTSNYQLAAEVEAYARVHATVAGVARPSQYDFWEAPVLGAGQDALWVSEGPAAPAALQARFAEVEELPRLEGRWGRLVTHRFRVQRLRGLVRAPPTAP